MPKDLRCKSAERLLRELNLYDKRNVKAKKLSKGMRQRLILCMALLNDPEILFLDEPALGLDVQSARIIRGLLRDSNKEKDVTVFLTTHNMEEANQLCDRIAIINHGRIAAIDTPERLKGIMRELQCVEIPPTNLSASKTYLAFHSLIKLRKLEKYFDYTPTLLSILWNKLLIIRGGRI